MSMFEAAAAAMGLSVPGVIDGIKDLHDFTRHYPDFISSDELKAMNQREFIRYCRENLWEGIAKEEYGKDFKECTEDEKMSVDLFAIVKIAIAYNNTLKEDKAPDDKTQCGQRMD